MRVFYRVVVAVVLALLTAPQPHAQIVFTAADAVASYTTSGSASTAVTSNTPANQAALATLFARTGSNQTWDFTGLTFDPAETVTFRPVTPPVFGSGDPHFAGATHIIESKLTTTEGLITGFAFGRITSNAVTTLGSSSQSAAGNAVVRFVPGATMPLPVTSTSSWVEAFALELVPASPVPITQATRTVATVVGWGTVVTPGGRAAVLMIRNATVLTSTITLPGSPPIVTTTVLDELEFLARDGAGAFIDRDESGVYSASYSGFRPTAGEAGPDALAAVAVWPNPVRGRAEIQVEADGPATVSVFDGLGRHIATLADDEPLGTGRLTWDASALPAGVYLVRVEAGGRVVTRRVSVVR